MALVRRINYITDRSGHALADVEVDVYTPALALATIYADSEGVTIINASRVTTGTNGRYSYWARAGNYVERLSEPGLTSRNLEVALVEGGSVGGGAGEVVAEVTGTDPVADAAAIQSALNMAAEMKTGVGRPLVKLPRSMTINIGAAALVGEEGIDFDRNGSILLSSIVSGRALTLGRDGYENANGYYDIYISRDYVSCGDVHLANDAAAFSIINDRNGRIYISADGFRSPVEFVAAAANLGTEENPDWGNVFYAAYGKVYFGEVRVFKYGVTLYSKNVHPVYGPCWINAIRFYGGNFQCDRKTCGSVFAVYYRNGYSDDNAALAVPNDFANDFFGPIFQLGNVSGVPAWSSGATVSTSMVGAYYTSGGYSYQILSAGTFGNSEPHTQTTNFGKQITNGTVVLRCEGHYVRSPFGQENVGSHINCPFAYYEGGAGPAVYQIGRYAAGGHNLGDWFVGGEVYNQSSMFGDRVRGMLEGDVYWGWVDSGATPNWYGNRATLRQRLHYGPQGYGVMVTRLRDDGWQHRAIKGKGPSGKWAIPGLVGMTVNALAKDPPAALEIGPNGLILKENNAHSRVGVMVPTRQRKRVLVSFHKTPGVEAFAGIIVYALDASQNIINLSTNSAAIPEIIGFQGSIVDWGGVAALQLPRTTNEVEIVCGENTHFLLICYFYGHPGAQFSGISIELYRDTIDASLTSEGFVYPHGSPYVGRYCPDEGPPSQGIFPTVGELIPCVTTTGVVDTAVGYWVTAAGAAADPWVAGETVRFDSWREHGGKIYRALAAGTCGSTAPTGTGASISDGAVTWAYDRPKAEFKAALAYEPADPRWELDYAPYNLAEFTLTADGNADGVCDGGTRQPFGSQTGMTYTYAVSADGQTQTSTRGTAPVGGRGEFFNLAATGLVPGHECLIIASGSNFSATSGPVTLYLFATGADYYSLTRLNDDAYSPTGYPTSPFPGTANDSGEVLVSARFTVPASTPAANKVVFSVYNENYHEPPFTLSGRVEKFWVIDLDAAEAGLGISLKSESLADLHGIIYGALTAARPATIQMQDDVLGPVAYRSHNGVLELVT